MRIFVMACLAGLLPQTGAAWEHFTEEDDGRTFHIAEQMGEAGSVLVLVCHGGEVHMEVVSPGPAEAIDDIALVFQVDARPERPVAGFVDVIDDNTSIFVGVDRRDKPAAATNDLLEKMAAGEAMYLGDPDFREAAEVWSMKGATKAIRKIRSNC